MPIFIHISIFFLSVSLHSMGQFGDVFLSFSPHSMTEFGKVFRYVHIPWPSLAIFLAYYWLDLLICLVHIYIFCKLKRYRCKFLLLLLLSLLLLGKRSLIEMMRLKAVRDFFLYWYLMTIVSGLLKIDDISVLSCGSSWKCEMASLEGK